ncbi:MAG TPA: response regulator [Chryseolinea sp.]|nr:response regulator [Chryseolinea sp.]
MSNRKDGTIIVIEDDPDDQLFIRDAFLILDYPNRIIFFEDGYKALEYIESTDIKPFLILSDVNMPILNGFELRQKIQNNRELSIRCIPYLSFTTGTDRQAVQNAYAMSAQGFFIKPPSMSGLESTLRKIVEYWQECHAPNQYSD